MHLNRIGLGAEYEMKQSGAFYYSWPLTRARQMGPTQCVSVWHPRSHLRRGYADDCFKCIDAVITPSTIMLF